MKYAYKTRKNKIDSVYNDVNEGKNQDYIFTVGQSVKTFLMPDLNLLALNNNK